MIIIFLILGLLCLLVLYYLFNGAIYLPTDRAAVAAMLRLVAVRPGMKLADLGSGDGRIVIAFARQGADTVGYEVNPLLVWWSRRQIRKAGLPSARIISRSFWSVDLAEFDVVVVFGMTHIMQRLQDQLWQQLRPGALVVSHIFRFPDRQPIREEGSIRVYQR